MVPIRLLVNDETTKNVTHLFVFLSPAVFVFLLRAIFVIVELTGGPWSAPHSIEALHPTQTTNSIFSFL